MSYKFLVNTLTHWNEPPRARHQVSYALAEKYPVTFVSANKLGWPSISKIYITQNLCVIIPKFFIDSRLRIRVPILNTLYNYWLYRKLRREYGDYIVINFDFTAVHLNKFFDKIVYYCNDDHIAISYKYNFHSIARYHENCENTIAAYSKFCISTSEYLKNKLGRINPSSFEIRLGAPVVENSLLEKVKTFHLNKHINIGLVGFIRTVSSDLLLYLLSHREIKITVIGSASQKEQDEFKNYANIRFTGTLVGDDLYKEVSQFDVGIIPYNVNSTIDRTPNKLWLYLSFGKPVVITNIKSIKDWHFPDKFVYRYNSDKEFYEQVIKAYSEDNENLMDQRIYFAKANSWENRMQRFIEICDNYIKV